MEEKMDKAKDIPKLFVDKPEDQSFTQLPQFWKHFYEDGEIIENIKPIVFINISGVQVLNENDDEDRNNSFYNAEEVKVAVKIALYLIDKEGVAPDRIAILSSFTAQKNLVETTLECNNIKNVACETFSRSQGKEWDYVILSCVMSRFNDFQTDDRAAEIINGEIGLLGVQNNFNVGITRAKFGLIIIGNKTVLAKNEKVIKPWLDNHRAVNWTDATMVNLFRNVDFIF